MITKQKTETINEVVKKLDIKHIAIIMDGNRRWAKEKSLPSAMGHQKGASALKKAIQACHKFGIKYLTVYAFSTENWNRKKEEVDFLMDLLVKTMNSELKELCENNVKVKFIGNLSKLNKELVNELYKTEAKTEKNTGLNLQIAFNYGARDEIVNAVKNIVMLANEGKITPEEISESTISDNLYTAGIPDPDLLIRTGSEMRLSNYLLWQIAYSEIYVSEEFWPEFDENSLSSAILEFQSRSRRFGK